MGIIHGEAAHTHQSVQNPRAFVTVVCPQLCIFDRKIAVRPDFAPVDLDMEGTVHGLDLVKVTLNLIGLKHIFSVKAGMT